MALIVVGAALISGLLLPSSDLGRGASQASACEKHTATRRAALETGAAMLPLLALPARTGAVAGDQAEIGFSGSLRGDIGPSILGDGVEVLITEQSYKELSACPPNFFVPAKGGPWTCLEITVTATNNVSAPRELPRARL